MDRPFVLSRGTKSRGLGLPMHAHAEAQLTFVVSGLVQVHTREGRWLVPPQLAVWVPENVLHQVDVLTDAELWLIHWQAQAARDWAPPTLPDRAFALRVTPLQRSLLAAAFAADIQPEKAKLVVRLMLHELTEAPDAPTFIPFPTSPIGRRVADIALQDRQNKLSVGAIASRAATSVRTLSRLFPAETGMTFKAWRQRTRVVQAMDQLGRGVPIAHVSAALGFASAAAFSSAFRQVTAMTPTAFAGRPDATAG
ncbi:AraC family transcriptional regulator [Microvirga antarctica]|uniref:AraC family transcriptional regulator n=1 Tax=Microvirga antarctica TaxID=2819233 RepID=UPI001B3155D9|nr:helix-turn-helix domain-containing protein [Microvirga antarctica]